MAAPGSTPIQLYHTTTAAAQPVAGNLLTGELAANVTDKKIYTKDGGGNVVQVASGPDATETLTNKTLTSPTIQGTVAAGTGLTMPAMTLGGTVTSNGQSFNGTIANLGTVTTIDINGGTIDGTTIGASTRAAGNFTTLDANGNVTLGDASTDTVTVNGYMLVGTASNTYNFRATIDFDGNATNGFVIHNSNAGGTPVLIEGKVSGTGVFYVANNGNVTNTNNSYGAISDLKLKENITDATPKLSGLMQVRIVNYNLKTDPSHKQLGVIAQELEQIFPGMVEETPDYIDVTKTREVEVSAVLDEEGNEVEPATTRTEEYTEHEATGEVTKSVKYSVFVPMLIKAVQEQQAIIESLTTRLAALEAV
jgi:hypothetical protein